MNLRPETKAPDTSNKLSKDQLDAEVAHESTLRYFVENTELGVLDKDQMGVIALVDACQTLGIQLPATSQFFERLRQLSSGEEGKGRVQVKEVITAGAFPMSLLFGQQQKTGIIESIKGLLGRKTEQPQQQVSR
ncbi:MAG: hypothetical protein IMZ43_01505 [Thermoplasmata archaeon]|nr:hypothetical protein [Thermoplasmata archaeon]